MNEELNQKIENTRDRIVNKVVDSINNDFLNWKMRDDGDGSAIVHDNGCSVFLVLGEATYNDKMYINGEKFLIETSLHKTLVEKFEVFKQLRELDNLADLEGSLKL